MGAVAEYTQAIALNPNSAEAYNNRIRCAFAGAAITNFITYMENTAPIRLEDRRAEYGDERDPQMREFLTHISPVTNVSTITKPIAIAQAGHDTRVPVEQGEQMVKALRANAVPVWYALYKDEGHDGFPSSTTINNFNQYIWILFVEKYLLSPAPAADALRGPSPAIPAGGSSPPKSFR